MKCDFHIHSLYSDGTYSPSEIIREAKEKSVVVALTDHNTTHGLAEFMEEAEKSNVTAIAGVELSTDYLGKELHLIGLFIEPQHYSAIEDMCRKHLELKEQSNFETVERLNKAGYKIAYEDVKCRNYNGNINRAHIAAELLSKGYVKSTTEAFETLLDESYGFYKPSPKLGTLDAIKFLQSINALPILAHPLKDISEDELRALLPKAKKAGLLGIETHHSSYDEEKIEISLKTAAEFELLKSGGSDFHGTNKPGISIGEGKGNLDIPIEFYEKMLKKRKKSDA